MFKVTPNPPGLPSQETLDTQAADRAFAHYELPPGRQRRRASPATITGPLPSSHHREETLVNASAILESAAATAYENADNLTGSNRKVALGVVHLIELAQRMVDSLLEEEPLAAG